MKPNDGTEMKIKIKMFHSDNVRSIIFFFVHSSFVVRCVVLLPQSAVKLEVIKGVLSDGYTGHYFLFKNLFFLLFLFNL